MPKTPYSELIKGNAYITSTYVEAYTVEVDGGYVRFTHNDDGTIQMECLDNLKIAFTCTINRDQQQAIRLGMSTSITNENSG